MGANRLASLYSQAGYGRYADRVELCATKLVFRVAGDRRELQSANFCRLRLCPMCIARGAIVRGKQLSKVMDGVQAEHGCQYVFLTLTVRNVPGNKLKETLSEMTKSWNRLLQHSAVKRAVKGWFRAIEITRNTKKGEWYGTYHPHIHAVIAVEDEYFDRKSGLYISHAEWVRRWKMAFRMDYEPRVYISKTYEKGNKGQRIGGRGRGEASRGTVLEAAKYATKDNDYISDKLSNEEAVQVVRDYTEALYHRRLTAFGGWLKEMAARLETPDLDNVDLVHGDEEHIRDDLVEMIETYYWHFGAGDYVLAGREINPLRVKREGGENDGNEGNDKA